MSDVSEDELLGQYRQELRRGSAVLAALLVLRRPGYGYGLLDELSAAGIEVEANTLYPLLRRLESHGLLTSEWDTSESRPRKFYRTSPRGDALAAALLADERRIAAALAGLSERTEP